MTRSNNWFARHFFCFVLFFDLFRCIFFFDIFALIFCLQTLSKTFNHLLIYWLNHVKCFKNWKQWNIYETTLLKFRFFSFYFEKVLISFRKNHYLEKISMLFVFLLFCSLIFFCYSLIDHDLKKFKNCCMFCLFVYCFTNR